MTITKKEFFATIINYDHIFLFGEYKQPKSIEEIQKLLLNKVDIIQDSPRRRPVSVNSTFVLFSDDSRLYKNNNGYNTKYYKCDINNYTAFIVYSSYKNNDFETHKYMIYVIDKSTATVYINGLKYAQYLYNTALQVVNDTDFIRQYKGDNISIIDDKTGEIIYNRG